MNTLCRWAAALVLGCASSLAAAQAYPAKPIRQSLREAIWLAKQTSPKART